MCFTAGYGKSFGQNLAAGQPTWTRAMGAWFREAQFFKYGENPKEYLGPGGWKKIGHYTHVSCHRDFDYVHPCQLLQGLSLYPNMGFVTGILIISTHVSCQRDYHYVHICELSHELSLYPPM